MAQENGSSKFLSNLITKTLKKIHYHILVWSSRKIPWYQIFCRRKIDSVRTVTKLVQLLELSDAVRCARKKGVDPITRCINSISGPLYSSTSFYVLLVLCVRARGANIPSGDKPEKSCDLRKTSALR